MPRIFFLFLILSLSIVHGHINYAMFGGEKALAQITVKTALTAQQDVNFTIDHEIDECCAKDDTKKPAKIPYCQLDFCMSRFAVELNHPGLKQHKLPGPGLALVSKDLAFPLRPPIS